MRLIISTTIDKPSLRIFGNYGTVSIYCASVDRQTSLFFCPCRWFVALLPHLGAIWRNAVGVLARKRLTKYAGRPVNTLISSSRSPHCVSHRPLFGRSQSSHMRCQNYDVSRIDCTNSDQPGIRLLACLLQVSGIEAVAASLHASVISFA